MARKIKISRAPAAAYPISPGYDPMAYGKQRPINTLPPGPIRIKGPAPVKGKKDYVQPRRKKGPGTNLPSDYEVDSAKYDKEQKVIEAQIAAKEAEEAAKKKAPKVAAKAPAKTPPVATKTPAKTPSVAAKAPVVATKSAPKKLKITVPTKKLVKVQAAKTAASPEKRKAAEREDIRKSIAAKERENFEKGKQVSNRIKVAMSKEKGAKKPEAEKDERGWWQRMFGVEVKNPEEARRKRDEFYATLGPKERELRKRYDSQRREEYAAHTKRGLIRGLTALATGLFAKDMGAGVKVAEQTLKKEVDDYEKLRKERQEKLKEAKKTDKETAAATTKFKREQADKYLEREFERTQQEDEQKHERGLERSKSASAERILGIRQAGDIKKERIRTERDMQRDRFQHQGEMELKRLLGGQKLQEIGARGEQQRLTQAERAKQREAEWETIHKGQQARDKLNRGGNLTEMEEKHAYDLMILEQKQADELEQIKARAKESRKTEGVKGRIKKEVEGLKAKKKGNEDFVYRKDADGNIVAIKKGTTEARKVGRIDRKKIDESDPRERYRRFLREMPPALRKRAEGHMDDRDEIRDAYRREASEFGRGRELIEKNTAVSAAAVPFVVAAMFDPGSRLSDQDVRRFGGSQLLVDYVRQLRETYLKTGTFTTKNKRLFIDLMDVLTKRSKEKYRGLLRNNEERMVADYGEEIRDGFLEIKELEEEEKGPEIPVGIKEGEEHKYTDKAIKERLEEISKMEQ